MGVININDVKSAFETGDRPTGADYVNLIDTLAANATLLGAASSNNDSNLITITGIETATTVDTFSATEWRVAKYAITLSSKVTGENKYYATELTVLVDNNDVNVSEYGSLDNNGDVGTISVLRDGANINLVVTPQSALKPVTVRFNRTGLKA